MGKDREPRKGFSRRALGRLATGAMAAFTFGQKGLEQAKDLVPTVAQKLSPVSQWYKKYNIERDDIQGVLKLTDNNPKALEELMKALRPPPSPEEIARRLKMVDGTLKARDVFK